VTSLLVVLSSSRSSVYLNPFLLPLALYLSISMSRETLALEPVAFYDGGGGDDGIVAVRVSCEGGSLHGTAATEVRLVFVGHLVVVDETETFVLRSSCSNYLET